MISASKKMQRRLRTFLRNPVFMGRPDKPGDDDQGGDD
jgi:hypothetical protein